MLHNVHHILLITPQTSEVRIAMLDKVSSGFLYVVSSAGTTGGALSMDGTRTAYFERLQRLRRERKITNRVMIGFGIHDRAIFLRLVSMPTEQLSAVLLSWQLLNLRQSSFKTRFKDLFLNFYSPIPCEDNIFSAFRAVLRGAEFQNVYATVH